MVEKSQGHKFSFIQFIGEDSFRERKLRKIPIKDDREYIYI